jgi:hypothetical protein
LGLFYKEDRPTLGDAMDETIRAAGGKVMEQAAVA